MYEEKIIEEDMPHTDSSLGILQRLLVEQLGEVFKVYTLSEILH
jgi:hypothetical protein